MRRFESTRDIRTGLAEGSGSVARLSRLRPDPPIHPPRVLVSLDRFFHLRGSIRLLLHTPALVYPPEAPFRAVARCPDRLAVHDDEDRIGVRVRERPDRDPTTLCDRHLEAELAGRPIY